MNQSSLTEDTPSTPGWVDVRLAEIFQPLGPAVGSARDRYAECLANVRGAVDVDAGHDRCRAALMTAIRDMVEDPAVLDRTLQQLEAEISAST